LQRLSTMFTCGWPRRALLLLRIAIVAILTQDGILAWMGALQREPISLHIVAAIAGVFLLLGLWTPVAGAIVALSEIGIVPTAHAHPQYTIPLQRKASLSHFWDRALCPSTPACLAESVSLSEFPRGEYHPSKEGMELNPVGSMR
jgi:uncharacterized membrane protein YphA (DoxX/SURF4 family)